jgi:hypothetical protein
LCRTCHDRAHDDPEFNARIKLIHLDKLRNYARH